MKKDMKEMGGNITNVSIEHRDQSNIGGHITSHTQWGYYNFSPHARTFEHNSYDCYEGNGLGTRNTWEQSRTIVLFLWCKSRREVSIAKEKFMKSSMGEKSIKVNELIQTQNAADRKVIHHENKSTCTFVKEEKSYTMNPLFRQQFHEEQGKMREKRRVSFYEEQSVIESISTSLEECECEKSGVSTKESEGKRKKTQNMENEGSLCYKLYKTIKILHSTSFFFFDFIIKESNCCSFSLFNKKIEPQLFNILTKTCRTKLNHEMKAKGEGMGKELSIG
ncbi:hypothetical protein M9H77_35984 [Catharanthus roseus]|uniref:Uncharacterized protein n=1 Tax=Catharanthus roseus TaxID=4058 RepID=A0ACB9ZSA9_CATRO|nr:hypothetical protein M9H77_35984 [Catharanthus roseus]